MIAPHIIRSGMVHGYERRAVFGVEEVLSKLQPLQDRDDSRRLERWWSERLGLSVPPAASGVEFDGVRVPLCDKRLHTFARSVHCAGCERVGSFFALERVARWVPQLQRWVSLGGDWNMSLYALRVDGSEVLMTRDHIHPTAKGGSDGLENSQTMCLSCNNKKGDRWEEGVAA